MSATDPHFHPLSQTPFLYQIQIGGVATIAVTHNADCINNTFSGNLALHVNDDAPTVLSRRAHLEASFGQPIQWLNQVHGVIVHAATSLVPAPTADAAVTANPHIALAVMTADCLPVVISARNELGQSAVGIAHAGWRGLLGGVIEATLSVLNKTVPQAQLSAHLGPCIGVAQFEVGSEVREAFLAKNATNAIYFTAQPLGKYLCDLESLARAVLYQAGATQVSGGGWCTVSDPRLASFRRNAVTGRFATLVALNLPPAPAAV